MGKDDEIYFAYTDTDGEPVRIQVSPSTALQIVQGLTARLEEWAASDDDAQRD